HFTYALLGDGDMMEGISSEAASLAGHLKLGKLVFMYDANDISLDGPNSLTFTEDVSARFEAFGWQVLHIANGDTDLDAIEAALLEAKSETTRPSLIVVKTTIGYGSPNKAGTSGAHGAPLGADELKLTKAALGVKTKAFGIEAEALEGFRATRDRGEAAQAGWNLALESWSGSHKALAKEWEMIQKGEFPNKWDAELPVHEAGSKIASRDAGHKALNAIAAKLPNLIGGDADLSCSTKTFIKDGGDFEGQGGTGRNIRYGVREHTMGAVANGIAYHGGLRSFTGTFFVFSDYMRPAMRLAALNHLPVTFVFTHDSIGVGEDGPTHQPIEHLASLRAMPGLVVIRPGDAEETNEAWRYAMNEKQRPVTLIFSRQGLETVDRETHASAEGLTKGAYTLSESKGMMKAVVIATGSEVGLALAAQAQLHEEGVPTRVVSMPSWELFEDQPEVYREAILPTDVTAKVSVEAGCTFGWSKWIGDKGVAIGIDSYGASAPANLLYEKFGVTVERVVSEVKKLTGKR
ncbi:MAG: transketolase, partial [Planctomycetota bacterium]